MTFLNLCEKIVEKTVTVPHDTTIYITTEPVHIYHSLECDSLGIIKAFKRTFRQGSTIITEEVNKSGTLIVTCAEDSLKQVIEVKNTTINSLIEHNKSEVKINTVTKNAWYVPILCWFSLISIFLWAFTIVKLYLKFKP